MGPVCTSAQAGRRVAVLGLIVAMLATLGVVASGGAWATPAARERSGQSETGPTYVTQDWMSYVEGDGTVTFEAEVPAHNTNSGEYREVSEAPGEVSMVATSPTGREHTISAPWDTATGAVVTGSFGPDGTAGVWRLQLTATTASGQPWPQAWAEYLSVHPWSITVYDAAGTAQPGRVWTETYYQSEIALSARGVTRWDQTHWLLSDTGVKYRVSQYGFNGYRSRMVVDDLGLTDEACQPIHRSASMGERGVKLGFTCPEARLFRIFFEQPDASMPSSARFYTGTTSWVMPRYAPPSIPELTWSQSAPGAHWGGDVLVTLAGQAGTVEVLIDVDDDGTYDGDRDVRLSQVLPLGTTAIGWDGLDGAGDPVPLTQPVRFRAELARFGEIHFMQSDVEYREGGIEVEALTGPQAGSRALWWDDSALPGCHRDNISNGLAACDGEIPPLIGDGVDSTGGVHRWGAGAGPTISYELTTWGDGKHIDGWTYHRDKAVSEVLRAAGALEVSKTADAETVVAGTATTHAWTVTNTGDVDRFDVVAVDDLSGVLPAGVIDPESISATTGDVDVDLDEQTITWTGDLLPGQDVTVVYDVQVTAPAQVAQIVDTVSVTDWDAQATIEQQVVDLVAAIPPSSDEDSASAARDDPAPGSLAVTGSSVGAAAALVLVLLSAGAGARLLAGRRA